MNTNEKGLAETSYQALDLFVFIGFLFVVFVRSYLGS